MELIMPGGIRETILFRALQENADNALFDGTFRMMPHSKEVTTVTCEKGHEVPVITIELTQVEKDIENPSPNLIGGVVRIGFDEQAFIQEKTPYTETSVYAKNVLKNACETTQCDVDGRGCPFEKAQRQRNKEKEEAQQRHELKTQAPKRHR